VASRSSKSAILIPQRITRPATQCSLRDAAIKQTFTQLACSRPSLLDENCDVGANPLLFECGAASERKVKKKLKLDKFFMGKPSQNYGVPPKYGAHNFTCSPT